MTKAMALTAVSNEAPVTAMSLDWQTALETFLDTLSSPRTQKAYGRAVTEAMEAMGVHLLAELTPSILAQYRAGLVARLDIDREDKLSPSTVNLKLGALRSFLHSCRLTGVTPLAKDLIAFVLKSPKAEVRRPFEVLSEAERQRLLEAARHVRTAVFLFARHGIRW